MKYLKRFDEAFGQNGMFDWKVADMKHTPSSRAQLGLDQEDEFGDRRTNSGSFINPEGEEYFDDEDEVCPNCDCIPCQCTGEEYDEDEDLKEGLEENFTDWRINSYLKIAREKYNDMTSEEIINKIDNGPESMRFKNEEEKELFKQKWDNEKKEGTFAYYNAMTDNELRSLEKTFKHDFENPAQHDPKFVAYMKACELKKVFAGKDHTPKNLKQNKIY